MLTDTFERRGKKLIFEYVNAGKCPRCGEFLTGYHVVDAETAAVLESGKYCPNCGYKEVEK